MRKLRLVLFLALVFILVGCLGPPPGDQPPEMTNKDFLIHTVSFILFGVFIYFFLVLRPTFLKEDKQKKFKDSLKRNDEVVTSGGIYGRVVAVKDDHISLEISKNIKIRVKPDHVFAAPASGDSKPSEEKK